MAPMITQCPYCNTAFAVNEAQLQAAAGNVRCGACLNVFLAEDNLLPVGVAEDADVSDNETDVVDDVAADPDEADDSYPNETIAEQNATVPVAGQAEPDFTASFSATEPAWELLEEDPDELADDETDESTDEETSDGFYAETDAPAEADAEADADEESGQFDAAGYPDDDEPAQHSLLLDDAGRREPSLFALEDDLLEDERPTRFSAANRAALDDVAAPVELHGTQRPAIDSLRLTGSILLALLLCATIGLQLLWFQREELALREDWRPRIELMCAVLPCEVAPRHDLAAISSDNLVVRSHPDARDALLVSLSFRNEAPFPQPFPTLTLRFTDTDQQPVAMREFLPGEYLQEELRGMTMIPPNTTVQARVDLVDPGTDAINYEVFLGRAN